MNKTCEKESEKNSGDILFTFMISKHYENAKMTLGG